MNAKCNDRLPLARQLAGKGIRLTRQRRTLINLIEGAPGHLHASDIFRMANEKDRKVDRATVYRTLALLKDQGFIEELDLLHLDGSEHYYELKERQCHVHMGCRKCGRILEFESDSVLALGAEIRRRTGHKVESMRIEVAVLCSECRKK